MKSRIFLILSVILVQSAFAVDISPTVENNRPEKVSEWVYPNMVLLPVVVDKAEGDKRLEARLTSLQSAGVDLGLEKMIIEGDASTTETDAGGKDYAISWASASLRKKDGSKVSTYISKPFVSNVSANPLVKTGDSFTAEGDPNELLEAWKRLQDMLEEEDKSKKDEDERRTDAPQPSKDFGGANEQSRDQGQQAAQSPSFEVKQDPVITSTRDGCNMNIDFDQMVAIVQERTIQDGKEIAACQDTLTRYPMEKKYASCAAKVDLDEGKVYQQYTLSYLDPQTGGSIQVADCTADTDKSIPITNDTASCGIRHDFEKGLSYQRAKKTYIDPQGNIQTVQDCQDTETTYVQETTYDGCEDIIDIPGMKAVHQKRVRITKEGQYQYISECAPDTADYTELKQEACLGANRYTHDFGGGQSYLNQTIYYSNTSGNRKDVQTCQASTVTFQHKKDESVCSAINDDSTRQTTMYAKTYIEEESGTPVYLNDCQALSPAIPYVKTGDVWRVQSTIRKEFEPTQKDLSPISSIEGLVQSTSTTGEANCGPTNIKYNSQLFQWQNMASFLTYKGLPWSFNNYFTQYTVGPGIGKPSCTPSSVAATFTGNTMCVAGPDASNWTTSDGIKIDPVNSTASPTTVTTAALQNMAESISNGRVMIQQSGSTPRSANFTCTKAFCDMTTLLANPVYLRGDNSNYTDLETVTGSKQVCGDGANLNGKPM